MGRYHFAMQRNSNTVVWALFLALGFLWGSSYLWIKIGLETVPPFTLIAGRLVLASIFLWSVVLLTREPLPRARRQYGHLFVMALVNIVVPFVKPLQLLACAVPFALVPVHTSIRPGSAAPFWSMSIWL